jgi:hypothetical protein
LFELSPHSSDASFCIIPRFPGALLLVSRPEIKGIHGMVVVFFSPDKSISLFNPLAEG